MNNRINSTLSTVIIIALLVFSYSAYRFVNAYATSAEPTSFRSFDVTGDGKAVGVPDIAEFSFSVITEGDTTIADTQKENTEDVNEAIAFLKTRDIDEKDISTQSYNVNPRYQYFSCKSDGVCPPAKIVGYTVSQSVSVKIRDFDIIGDVLTSLVEAGANSVSQLQFTLDDPTSVQDDARAKAIKKAQKKAQSIADAGGFKLGRLLSISEGSQSPPVMFSRAFAEDAAFGIGGGGASGPTIEPGSEDVVVNVTLTYEIR